MKTFNNIFENKISPTACVDGLIDLLNSTKICVYPGYNSMFLDKIKNMLETFGTGKNKYIKFIQPKEFDTYAILGFIRATDGTPCLYIDCKDDQKPFVLDIEKLLKTDCKLRGKHIVKETDMITCITSGHLLSALSGGKPVKTTATAVKKPAKEEKVKPVKITDKLIKELVDLYNSRNYRELEKRLIDLVNKNGTPFMGGKGIYIGSSDEYTWNHHINRLYVSTNKPNELFFNVYYQTDSTDGDDIVFFKELLDYEDQYIKLNKKHSVRMEKAEILDAIKRLKNAK